MIGSAEEDSFRLAGTRCNLHQGDRATARDALTEVWVSLFNPRCQDWAEQFR